MKRDKAWGKSICLVRVYIACGCAWTFRSCALPKNKVAPLCQMVPTATNDQQRHFYLTLYPPMTSTAPMSETLGVRGPKRRLAPFGPTGMFCIILFSLLIYLISF